MKKPINLPKFANEDEEREYWDKIDLSQHLAASDMLQVEDNSKDFWMTPADDVWDHI